MKHHANGHEQEKDTDLSCKACEHEIVGEVQLRPCLGFSHDSSTDQLQEEAHDVASNKDDSQ